jgi:hypothetical protein
MAYKFTRKTNELVLRINSLLLELNQRKVRTIATRVVNSSIQISNMVKVPAESNSICVRKSTKTLITLGSPKTRKPRNPRPQQKSPQQATPPLKFTSSPHTDTPIQLSPITPFKHTPLSAPLSVLMSAVPTKPQNFNDQIKQQVRVIATTHTTQHWQMSLKPYHQVPSNPIPSTVAIKAVSSTPSHGLSPLHLLLHHYQHYAPDSSSDDNSKYSQYDTSSSDSFSLPPNIPEPQVKDGVTVISCDWWRCRSRLRKDIKQKVQSVYTCSYGCNMKYCKQKCYKNSFQYHHHDFIESSKYDTSPYDESNSESQ